MIAEFPFGPWLADGTDFKNPGLEVCINAIPAPGGYQPAFGFSSTVATLPGPALSAAMFERADLTRVVVAATAGDLHVIVNSTLTNGGLALSLTEPVRFVQFGQWVFATSRQGTWFLTDIESDVTFAACGWTIPKGRAAARIGDFMFMGNLTDTDASSAPYRIRWSPFNNPLGAWETNIGLQSDAVDMPRDLGPVMAITGGSTAGMIFQRNGLSRISYSGGSSVFNRQTIDANRGLVAPASVAQVGESVYYMSDDGFFVTAGTSGEAVSRGKIWKWFQDNTARGLWSTVQAAVDWPNRCVVWTVPQAVGQFSGLLYYNWETAGWSYVATPTDCIFSGGKPGLTLEEISALYPDLEQVPYSLDSDRWLAQSRVVAGFSGGALSSLTGVSRPATFGTGEFQVEPGKRVFVREVTPLLTDAAGSSTVTMQGRDTQRAGLRSAPDVPIGPGGFAPFNFDARYARVNISVPAGVDWSDAYGFQIDYSASPRT